MTIGLGSAGEVFVAAYTEREGRGRLISARRATPRERRNYEA
ncbi:BrnT family toxin [Usitatibacter palustris]